MKFILSVFVILFLANCSKPKTVLICGDHICVNKAEAEQYFQDNLSIEVKVVDKKVKKEIDLVELNLKENKNGKKKISILSKRDTKKDLKALSNDEINKIKKNIKDKNKKKRIAQKVIKNKQKTIREKKKIIKVKNKILEDRTDQTNKNNIIDVCSILEKCTIDEISKYLLKQGRKKAFPDITARQ
tara:strand:- start:263 stop:820 length:558 start_codon:yes stop_codon:yes gene_type:complete